MSGDQLAFSCPHYNRPTPGMPGGTGNATRNTGLAPASESVAWPLTCSPQALELSKPTGRVPVLPVACPGRMAIWRSSSAGRFTVKTSFHQPPDSIYFGLHFSSRSLWRTAASLSQWINTTNEEKKHDGLIRGHLVLLMATRHALYYTQGEWWHTHTHTHTH